jgi:hypothetical protein
MVVVVVVVVVVVAVVVLSPLPLESEPLSPPVPHCHEVGEGPQEPRRHVQHRVVHTTRGSFGHNGVAHSQVPGGCVCVQRQRIGCSCVSERGTVGVVHGVQELNQNGDFHLICIPQLVVRQSPHTLSLL